MAGFVDLRGREQERRMQQMLMMQEYMRKSALGPGESNVERVLREEAETEAKERELTRLETESRARIEAAGAETKLKEEAAALSKWEAGQEEIHRWETREREKRLLEEGQLPHLRAQTEAEIERKGLIGAQTRGEEEKTAATRDWRVNEQNDALAKHARDTWNTGVMGVVSGNPEMLRKDNVDRLESAGRALYGPSYRLPRDEQGNLRADQVPQLAATVYDASGVPSATFMKDLRAANEPYTPFESLVRASKDAESKGDKQAAKWFGDKLLKEVAPTLTEIQGAVLKEMKDEGRMNDFNDTLNGWRKSGAAKVSMPDAASRHDTEDMINTMGSVHRMEDQFKELTKRGVVPVGGYVRMKAYDLLNSLEQSNPDVQAFRANLMDTVALYRKFITGKASNEKEMADLIKAVPNENDDIRSFIKKMAEMRLKTQRKIRTNLGVQQAYGIQPPDLGPGFEPILPSEAFKKWGVPDRTTDSGKVTHGAVQMEQGTQAVADRARREGQRIGGVTEFRQSVQEPTTYRDQLSPELQEHFDQLSLDEQLQVIGEE